MKPKKVGNYTLFRELGKGQFGVVYLAKKTGTEDLYAVKQMNRHKIENNEILAGLLKTEVSVMHNINHPNILHLYEFMESSNSYYLVINYCDKGDLEEHMKKTSKDGFKEELTVYYLKQIMNGFQELRKNKIMHRDFKLANIFLKSDGTVVIGDFGFAKSGVEMTSTKLGTPLTMAPELIASSGNVSYTSKADLWSIGVVFYHMLQGKYPFFGMSNPELMKDIERKTANMPFKKPVSAKAKDLLSKLLVIDPDKRITWKGFFNHPIFQDDAKEINNNNLSSMLKGALTSYLKTNNMFRQNQEANEPGQPFRQNTIQPQPMHQKKVSEQDADHNVLEEITKQEVRTEIEMR
jgi:serine/threonine-protein kinase ULK/ATG1